MDLLEYLQTRQKQDADLFLHRMVLIDHTVTLAGYTSLIDLPQTMMLLQQQYQNAIAADQPLIALGNGMGECLNDADEPAVVSAMSEGNLIILHELSGYCMKITPVHRTLSRSIEAPSTENVVRGSISAFNEDLDTNIGIVKTHVMSDKLRMHSYWFGKVQRRRAMLLFMEGQTNPAFLDAVTRRVESRLDRDIPNLLALSKALGFPKWTLVTRYNTTELPENVASALGAGKVVLFLDRFPFAMILPSLMMDMFVEENDRNYPLFFLIAFRLLRIVGVLVNMLMPGLYVALVSVNPDVLRIELALSIARSRVDVPYPAIIETLLLLVTLELILEASIRLPKTIGPTITMVGGIILGQAVVQAKLVSNILIIILAATTIASFTVIGFHNAISIRISKYLLLILSAVYGVLGLFVGIVVVCAYLASVSTFGIPYLYHWKARDQSDG
ncbi:spore germination protein [Brevibacillus brevis]|uniref:Spore germination protein n=1 Tax=Brevibacillus brevis TaxID=1393 RepID=A0ABY9SYE4_BREBE|nr:spore germination protein [Brevibacillus brevis]WNC12619.1 spore germination protein [Brevibacillus brevis]